MTTHSAASSATSQIASQCRPLTLATPLLCGLERAELRRARPHVAGDFRRARDDRLLGQHAPQGAAATRTDGLTGWANARLGPLAEQMLDDAVFARMVGNDPQAAARNQRVAKLGQRGAELTQLVIYGDAQGLKEPREVSRPRPGPQCRADRIHEIIALRKGPLEAPPHDLLRQGAGAALVAEIPERRGEPLLGPAVQDI